MLITTNHSAKEGIIKMFSDLILNVCSIASLFACAFIPGISSFFSAMIITISLILLGALTWSTLKKKVTIVCRSEEKVKRTMYRILSKADGNIRIVSHRMSWLTEDILTLLCEKKENVIIYMERRTARVEELLAYGITVKTYGKYNFIPSQRFTIIRYGRNNSQIAIGEGSLDVTNFRHEIFLTPNKGSDMKSRWIKAIATDMIQLLDKVSEEQK